MRIVVTAVVLMVAGAASANAQSLRGLPPGPLGQAIQRGHDMMLATAADPEVKAYIGNALTCNSCHVNAGDSAIPGNFLSTASVFPAYSPREGAVITVEDRVANCFMRSMNGIRPGIDSPVIVDMTAYIDWLGRGKPILGAPPKAAPNPYAAMVKAATPADVIAGGKVYASTCAACHGAQGAGLQGILPPLWGANSYNAGAGLAYVAKLAPWVKSHMPVGDSNISAKEYFEVALFVDTHPRPDFVLSQHLPAGAAPDDYNAGVRDETDTVAGNLQKAGLSLQTLLGKTN